MRTPIIAANWKMHTTLSEAEALVKGMRERLDKIGKVEKVLCPPFVSLGLLHELLKGTSIKLGAQNMYFLEAGAFTGEVSPRMLAGLCDFVILGHSERRQHFGETDELVGKKVQAALRFGLKPILCVGETLEEREAGRTEQVVSRQLRKALEDVASPQGLVIAYEPVWAIGTGKAATAQQANATIALIRGLLAELYGPQRAQALRIQYGGSVNAANISQFLAQPDIDGALVGGASLKGDEFLSIVEQAAAIKGG